MDVTETELPGVGRKHEIELKSGVQAIVLTHNSGKRELMSKADGDVDPERLLELTDQEARVLGTVLEGAYFQPVESGDEEMMIADDLMIKWVTVAEASSIVGRKASEAVPGDITVLAIHRNGELLTGSPPELSFDSGDVVITTGTRDAVTAFEERAVGES
jgi:TrkA domain protein